MAVKVGAIIAVFKLLLMLQQSMLKCNTGFLFLFPPKPSADKQTMLCQHSSGSFRFQDILQLQWSAQISLNPPY